ncbi:MAG TPA: DUF6516 family protein [Gammaproteobacteria bacterium]|nr:DUF6516 family protein [Gammaproteobacteria bacterium]
MSKRCGKQGLYPRCVIRHEWGDIFLPSGYWYKIAARRLRIADSNFPENVKYSLTLHSPDGKRVLGYDNAHPIVGCKFDEPFDHVHKGARIVKYPYKGAMQLMTDFFRDIDVILDLRREYEHEI